MDIDLSTTPVTLSVTPVAGPRGPAGPAGIGSSLPGGRLTLVSGFPEMSQTADYSNSTLFYAPFESDQIPLFDGVNWASSSFTSDPLDTAGLSMAGGTKWAANSKHDVFVILVAGIVTLCTGPAWPSDSVASRGLVRRNGLWVNAASMACDLSATISQIVPVNQATWVGSISVGATAGILVANFTLGQNRRCDVWNLYHQKEIRLGVGCPIASATLPVVWNPSLSYMAGYQAFNNDLNNSGYYFTGLPQNVECDYSQWAFINTYSVGPGAAIITVCKDSLSSPTTWGVLSSDSGSPATGYMESGVSLNSRFEDRSSIGAHRAIMGCAGANNFGGVTLIGLDPRSAWGSLERGHVMWIKYQG